MVNMKKEEEAIDILINCFQSHKCIWNITSGDYKDQNRKSRSSQRRFSGKKGVLRNFSKFTGKHLRQSLSFNKVAGLRPATLLKQRLRHRCFPMNFVKFLRTPFLQNTSERLLLKVFAFRRT